MLFASVILLLYLISKSSGMPSEYSEKNPYYKDHPEELEPTEMWIEELYIFADYDNGNPIKRTNSLFSTEESLKVNMVFGGYSNPKVKENYYLYGFTQSLEIFDSAGVPVDELSGLKVDATNHFSEKGKQINLVNEVGSVAVPGKYSFVVTIYDKVSNKLMISPKVEFEIV